MMRRTLALALGVAAVLAAAPASAQTKWNLPAAYPADNPHTETLTAMAKRVAEATGGKLVITVHAGASLFKAPEIKRAVATGQAQAGEVLASIHENEDAIYGIDVVPFLATSYADSKKLYLASKPVLEKKLAAQGLMLLYAAPWAPQGLYTKKDINAVEDLKGLKWRSYSVGTARIGELVGAQSVTVQAAELAQALATGVVNALMTSGSSGYDAKIWETIDHYYDLQAWIPKNIVFVNKAAFDALDKPSQTAVLAAAKWAEDHAWAIWPDKANWYLDQLKAKGMKVQPPSPALRDGLKKVGDQLTTDWLKRAGADGQAVIDAYKKM